MIPVFLVKIGYFKTQAKSHTQSEEGHEKNWNTYAHCADDARWMQR